MLDQTWLVLLEERLCAPLVELVDARDSKSRSFGSAGSIPAGGTTQFFSHGIR